ncbi:CDP-alcohol phosphatidyltransferase family protein [Segatella maculosa]|uniref:CDP-alcohol phosphatidyltransferase family protein n=1 Tax=Segatella maculosa TaxID=439703 RepID=UPI0024917E51|nr:CDP-alcohol phosphatidyltransferase family protein [Segatella maculosa]
MSRFNALLQASFKSNDTEEWLDVHFTRPIGLVFALLWNKLNIHPNVITILSIFLGAGAGCMFYYTDLTHNLMGVGLLMLANFCDSTDGQMARLTGKKTLIGRMLDGFSGDVWFLFIYVAIAMRLYHQQIPCTDVAWSIGSWILCSVAGFLCHSPQSSLADYYRQIHLFFLKGKDGSELDSYQKQVDTLKALPKRGAFWERLFYTNYAKYCHSQEKRTPAFQRFFMKWNASQKEETRLRFLEGSRPLMKYTNLLTFNLRAIVCYIACLTDHAWLYPLFEIIVMSAMYVHMHRTHERLCEELSRELA